MNFFNQLEIYGDVIPYNTPLILNSGWGLLGYLHQDPYNVEFLMESIVDELNPSASNLIILKAGDGNVYWPTFSLNNIGNLNPGSRLPNKNEYYTSILLPKYFWAKK